MAKWRKKARAVDPSKLAPDSRIAHADAVHLIANRIIDDSERDDPRKQRVARDRVAKRIKYAIKTGELQSPAHAGFVVKNLLPWASHKWPGKFDDLPKHASGVAVVSSSVAVSAKGIAAPQMPSDIAQCHKVIADLAAQMSELRDELQTAKRQVAVEKADARKYRRNVEKNRENARRPRR